MLDHFVRNSGTATAPAGRRLLAWVAASALFTTTLTSVRGATSAEGFDYPAGSVMAWQNGGNGWAGPWGAIAGNGSLVTEEGSLTYPGLVSTGGKLHFTGIAATGTSTSAYRTNATALTLGTHWVRLLARNLNSGRRFFGLALFSGSSERLLLGQGSTYANWTINHVAGVSTNNTLQSSVDSSSVALLVLKLELQEGVERVTFWVNPDLTRPENVATAVGGTSYLTDSDFGDITRVRIGGGGYSATAGGNPTEHYLDEISLGPVSPFPLPPKLTCAATGGALTVSWPPQYLGWILQAQAGPLSAGLTNWAGGDILGTGSVTSTNLPIQHTEPMVLFRLRHW